MKIFKKIKNATFINSILLLSSGTMVAQIITVALTPVLTRIFSPAEFGIYAIVITAETIFGGVICGRYDISIVNEESERKTYALIKLSFIISLIFSFTFGVLYGSYYFIYKNDFSLNWYFIMLIIVALHLNGTIRILESVNNKYRQYKYMTVSYIYRTLTQNFGAVLMGSLLNRAIILVCTHVIGLFFGLRLQAKSIKHKLKEIRDIPLCEIKEVANIYYRQPFFSAPAVLMNRLSYGGIILALESLYGVATLGIYVIANKILGIPISILSNNVSKVFYKEAAEEYKNTGSFIKSFIRISLLMVIISVPLFSIIYFTIPYIIVFLLGAQWIDAGKMIQILCPLFSIRLIVGSIAHALQIVQKQKIELLIQILFIVSLIFSYLISHYLTYSSFEFLKIVSITFSIVYLLFYLYVLYKTKNKERIITNE